MAKRCDKCGAELLVDKEVDRKYQTGSGFFIGAGAGNRALDHLVKKQQDIDSCGISCAVCGRNYCVKCMKRYGRPHPSSGGLACLDCGGRMVHYRG